MRLKSDTGLVDQVAADLKHGLAGTVHKFAIITDSNVEPLYARPLEQKLAEEGFQTDVFIFPAGEKSKTRQTKAMLEDAMLEKGYRRDCCILAVGGGVVTDPGRICCRNLRQRVYHLSIMLLVFWRQQMHLWAARQQSIHRWQRI